MAESLQKGAELALEAQKPELVRLILSKSICVYEKDFEKLRNIYQSMANSMDKAIEYKNKPRFFGSYYRVAFFGKGKGVVLLLSIILQGSFYI